MFPVCFSVANSCPSLCNTMDCSPPVSSVLYYLWSFFQFKSTESAMLSKHLILCCSFSFCLQSFPASQSFPIHWLFSSDDQSIGASASVSAFPVNIDFLEDLLVWSPCSPRDSQESFPTPQFKSIDSLALSLLHSPTLTSIHDHRKNHSLH